LVLDAEALLESATRNAVAGEPFSASIFAKAASARHSLRCAMTRLLTAASRSVAHQ
jgi:hypothetical protein